MDLVTEAVRWESDRRAAAIEKQLQRHNVVAVEMPGDPSQYVIYRVPKWREAPRSRARIGWLRFRRRLRSLSSP